MTPMEWDDFYAQFTDWADSTCRSRISALQSIGIGEEVVDAILYLENDATRAQLMRKAMRLGVTLTAEDYDNLFGVLADELYAEVGAYTGLAVDDTIISKDWPISDEEIQVTADDVQTIVQQMHPPAPKKRGFWAVLVGLGNGFAKKNGNGRCDGDCDHCPAHYGYRFGRWYYGHGHQYGCQRGGNGGASGRCHKL